MNRMITGRQATVLMICLMIATKFQKLLSKMSELTGKDGWIVMMIWLVIDTLFLWLLISLSEKWEGRNFYEYVEKSAGKASAKILCIIFIVYFFIKAVVTFKGTHEFFSITLFDRITWKVFSVFILVLLILICGKGLRVIGRSAEFYIYLISFGLLASTGLGMASTDFSRLLPVLDSNLAKLFYESTKISIYFGDYIIAIFFFGNMNTRGKSIKLPMIISFLVTGLIIILIYAIFYGIYGNMSESQIHGLSDLTQFTLIGFGVGRLDWFFVLFVFISTILSTALFVWIVLYNFTLLAGLKLNYTLSIIAVILLYIFEYHIFSDIEAIFKFESGWFRFYSLFVHIVTPFFLLILAPIFAKKQRRTVNGKVIQK